MLAWALVASAVTGLALLALLERRRVDRLRLLGVGGGAGPLASPVVRRVARPRPVTLTVAPTPASSTTGTMVVLPVDADVSKALVGTLRRHPGPMTVMTVAVSTPTRPSWSGEIGGAAWRNAAWIARPLGRGVAVTARRGRLDDVVRDASRQRIGLIVVPDGTFPAGEVDRLARRVASTGGLALSVSPAVSRAGRPSEPPDPPRAAAAA